MPPQTFLPVVPIAEGPAPNRRKVSYGHSLASPDQEKRAVLSADGPHLAAPMRVVFEHRTRLVKPVVGLREGGSDNVQDREGVRQPIYDLAFSPDGTQLIVAAGAEVLVYDPAEGELLQSLRAHKEPVYCINYSADGTSVDFFSSGDYVVVGGSDHKATLWTAEGVRLGNVCERDAWVWTCKVKPRQNFVAVGCQDGSVAVYQIAFNTVHGLYNDRYAYRENMTDVVIQHLSTDQRARIKCRDYVKKIAVYKDRLAVQLPDRVIVYELFHDDATDMHYRIREKMHKKLECNLLVVTSQHIILCQEKKLQAFQFSGEKEREWNLEALIRYIKVTGGPRGREGLVVGLKDGQILRIFLDNPFPIPLLKLQSSVRCLDLSMNRTKLAVVDDHGVCFVYDLDTKEVLFQEPNANSVAWNTELEDLLCYSGNGVVNVKAGNFPPVQQKMQGFVVGFKGAKVFCLHVYSMTSLEITYTGTIDRYIGKKEFGSAYEICCLGATESDWRRLAFEALEGLDFDVARRVFMRLRDVFFLDLLGAFDKLKAEGKSEPDLFLGEIFAYLGRFHEAAKAFKKSGNHQRAIEMYTELNMWDHATQLAAETKTDTSLILKRKARTQQDRNDLVAAAATYMEVGDYLQAINILGPSGSLDKLLEITRRLKKTDTMALNRCLFFFRKHNHHAYAAECLVKMGDITHLLDLHIELQQWDDAFRIAENHPEFAHHIYLPYANWLAVHDRYLEAQDNYRKAGRLDEAIRVLEQLAKNSVFECRFEDAAYYYWLLSVETLDMIPENVEPSQLTDAHRSLVYVFTKYRKLSEVYFAYNPVKRFIDYPFTPHLPESLLNMARFITHHFQRNSVPNGISKAYVMLAMAKIGKTLGANKLARYAFDQLLGMVLAPDWEEVVEIGALSIRGRPSGDPESLQTVCFACAAPNPLLNSKGDVCHNCQEPFVRSFYSFEVLPLVEFVLDDGITDDEAAVLIAKEPPLQLGRPGDANTDTGSGNNNHSPDRSRRRSENRPSASEIELDRELATLDDGGGVRRGFRPSRSTNSGNGSDAGGPESAARGTNFVPYHVGRAHLLAMRPGDVFVVDFGRRCIPRRYYRAAQPGAAAIVQCGGCKHFFLDDEWNYQYLQRGCCYFCRSKAEQP
ncbi:hypothetical protein HK405_002985 [Cladochytrium tenue]|nr:hypothetical protein HK405_002985 [Cladochytrium tenue]